MTMTPATLAAELRYLTPTTDENAARGVLAAAYSAFAAEATAGAVSIPATNLEAARLAMESSLIGMSVDGAGLAIIPAAVASFWAAAVVPPWPPAVGATPPPNAGLAALFSATCAANVADGAGLDAATDRIASDMHGQAVVGGLLLIPPPASGTPTPIE